jgi:adenine-specific DNA-methyltransferase
LTRARYIGSKARIADRIVDHVGPPRAGSGFFVDAFSGTGVVGVAASNLGWPVRFNDHLVSAVITSSARLLAPETVPFIHLGGYREAIKRLNELSGDEGFIWREYSPASTAHGAPTERRYFTEKNAAKIDAVRARIEAWARAGAITAKEKILLVADLLSATNGVANIAGTYGCFLQTWSANAVQPIALKPRELRAKTVPFETYNVDVERVPIAENDVAYFDPPYTKRQYAAYYHILETIAHGDEPEVRGVTGLRPWHDKASAFCYKTRALSAITSLVEKAQSRRLFLSYSSEGHISRADLERSLTSLGEVKFHELGNIGRYRPNLAARSKASHVAEFLVEVTKVTIARAAA